VVTNDDSQEDIHEWDLQQLVYVRELALVRRSKPIRRKRNEVGRKRARERNKNEVGRKRNPRRDVRSLYIRYKFYLVNLNSKKLKL
jgi:hypothetical protein